MMTQITNQMSEIIEDNQSLRNYLSHLSEGRKATPRSWLYETVPEDEVLNNWKKILSNLENGSGYEQEVYQFDLASESKWGPQGKVDPLKELLKEVVLPTFEEHDRPKAFQSKEWEIAKNSVRALFRSRRIHDLTRRSLRHVVDDMRARDTLESSSGWPDFKRRNLPEVKTRAIEDAQNGLWKTYPAIALFRNYRQKTRLVWMFPMAANLFEAQFYQPLQDAMIRAKIEFFSPWEGFDKCRKVITSWYDGMPRGSYIQASDFSATDEHFRLSATLEVYDVIKDLFRTDEDRKDLLESLTYMHTIPLLISDSEMIVGEHGVSSGSNWTNFIETIFDLIFGYYVQVKSNHTTDQFSKGIIHSPLYGIGDDMTWESDKFDKTFNKHLEKWGLECGQVIKAEKTTNDPDKVKTLQRLFIRGYSLPGSDLLRGVYPTIRALNSLIYPEKFHRPKDWNSDMFCARTYMILENCVDHPLFHEFVNFVVHGQKDLIEFAHKSDSRLTLITRLSKLLPGLNPTYNQEKKDSSLSEFASIKWVRENL